MLPSDLKEAESNVYESVQSYFLSNSEQSFLSINLKFDGLRLNPITVSYTHLTLPTT